eukprot:TRINITY_DN2441_c0_g2_i1.p1 TRINITY_DN2441_c0_g2~~TRINITY_DN2441_c0_g2_i1.p1  ORF type:complete len:412 (-),score=81.33 TRINITY_DN2441_c0_g2_i1:299-1429(-)
MKMRWAKAQLKTVWKCLPGCKSSKKATATEDAARKLSDNVELLLARPRWDECRTDSDKELYKDVQKQLHTILDLLKELSRDENGEPSVQTLKAKQKYKNTIKEFVAADLPVRLLAQLTSLEFEVRKTVISVCCALLWHGLPEEVSTQVLGYLRCHPSVFHLLAERYSDEEAALHCGVVLRSFLRHADLVDAFLSSGKVFELVRHARNSCINIAFDAIDTLHMVMLTHAKVSGPWLLANFEEFFALFNPLLECEDYFVERQALTLLTGILMDKRFQQVMIVYVSSDRNLQIVMNLLLDDSAIIQAQAFHVFKLFVVNPQKPKSIQQILVKNKEKLVTLLESLHPVWSDDESFVGDQQKVIGRLRHLHAKAVDFKASC